MLTPNSIRPHTHYYGGDHNPLDICPRIGVTIPSDQVGVFSGMLGPADDLFVLDLVMLLHAPLLSTDSPLFNPPPVNLRGHVGSSGLSIWSEGGRRPTTLPTNLCSPRSIFTWIMCGPPERGLFSPESGGEKGSS